MTPFHVLRFHRAFAALLPIAAATLCAAVSTPALAAPSGRAVIAWHVTISPSWFDPSTAPPQITPFGMLYAIHDALVRPYPGHRLGPSLAEYWSESPDGKTYEFKLRAGLKFHNGAPITTEDVKFSFERYSGAAAKTLHEHVVQVEIVDPLVVRFHLNAPWPDFMTFYGAERFRPRKRADRIATRGAGVRHLMSPLDHGAQRSCSRSKQSRGPPKHE